MRSSRGAIPAAPRQGLDKHAAGTPWHLNFSLVDDDGPFAWPSHGVEGVLLPAWLHALNRKLDVPTLLRERIPNSDGSVHHSVSAERCSEPAQERLQDLLAMWGKLMDQRFNESLFSLRYCLAPNSTQRVWGIFEDDLIFYALWWDPNHDVYAFAPDDRATGNCLIAKCLHLNGAGLPTVHFSDTSA